MSPKTVDFSNRGLKFDTREDVKQICNQITPETETLILEGNTFGIEAAAAIGETLASCPNLKYAYFKDMFTSRLKTEVPPALKHLFEGIIQSGAQLIELDVSDNAFGPHGAKELRPFLESPSAKKLQVLLLNNLGLGIGGGSHMAPALSELTDLRVLKCGRNRLEVEASIAIAESLKQISSLEQFEIYQNGIRPRGIEALAAALICNPNLKSLNMMDNTIKSQGARALTEVINQCSSLEALNLSDCLLKNTGASAIIEALAESTSIQDLNLAGNEIGGIDMVMKIEEILFNKPGLKIDLSFNSFGRFVSQLEDTADTNVILTIEDDEGTNDEDEDEQDDDGDDGEDEDQGDDEDTYEDISNDESGTGNGHQESFSDQTSREIDHHVAQFVSSSMMYYNPVSREIAANCIPSLRKLLEQAKVNASVPYQLSNSILVHLGLLKEESTRKYRQIQNVGPPLSALAACIDVLEPNDRQTLALFLREKKVAPPDLLDKF